VHGADRLDVVGPFATYQDQLDLSFRATQCTAMSRAVFWRRPPSGGLRITTA